MRSRTELMFQVASLMGMADPDSLQDQFAQLQPARKRPPRSDQLNLSVLILNSAPGGRDFRSTFDRVTRVS